MWAQNVDIGMWCVTTRGQQYIHSPYRTDYGYSMKCVLNANRRIQYAYILIRVVYGFLFYSCTHMLKAHAWWMSRNMYVVVITIKFDAICFWIRARIACISCYGKKHQTGRQFGNSNELDPIVFLSLRHSPCLFLDFATSPAQLSLDLNMRITTWSVFRKYKEWNSVVLNSSTENDEILTEARSFVILIGQ